MLDGIDAGADGALGALGAVRVGGGLAPARVRLIDERVQLFLRQLRRVHVVVQREDAARRADLDHVGAVLDVAADGGAHGVGAVGDRGVDAGALVEHVGAVADGRVAVAAGRADGAHGDEHPRPLDLAAARGVAQPHVDEGAGAEVAHRREADHQSLAHVDRGVERLLGDRLLEAVKLVLLPVVARLARQVRVRVHEAGQQRRVAEVDHLRARRRLPARARILNPPAHDDDDAGRHHAVAPAVEHPRGLDDDGFRLAALLREAVGVRGGQCAEKREEQDEEQGESTNVSHVWPPN